MEALETAVTYWEDALEEAQKNQHSVQDLAK